MLNGTVVVIVLKTGPPIYVGWPALTYQGNVWFPFPLDKVVIS